ncbi:hypothetical protein TgHK011_002729 [Trichoderma gracile]|nr:hypothetical protein TgHK011_002729 [Trichoderma gracile]
MTAQTQRRRRSQLQGIEAKAHRCVASQRASLIESRGWSARNLLRSPSGLPEADIIRQSIAQSRHGGSRSPVNLVLTVLMDPWSAIPLNAPDIARTTI